MSHLTFLTSLSPVYLQVCSIKNWWFQDGGQLPSPGALWVRIPGAAELLRDWVVCLVGILGTALLRYVWYLVTANYEGSWEWMNELMEFHSLLTPSSRVTMSRPKAYNNLSFLSRIVEFWLWYFSVERVISEIGLRLRDWLFLLGETPTIAPIKYMLFTMLKANFLIYIF